jgi:multidrug efflux pump subunit AcrA (membrane-fusion protein)
VEILSGLKEGDTVVVGRHAGLREGQKVQVN